jgi:hypothetical protein
MKPITLYAGVDPGLAGAIAVLTGDGRVRDVVPMPVVKAGAGGKLRYDVAMIRDLIAVWRHEGVFVTVEAIGPMPSKVKRRGKPIPGSLAPPPMVDVELGGSLANFYRGMTWAWEWMLVALGVPHEFVPPKTWQKPMHMGTPAASTKERSILAARRVFPGQDLRRSPRARNDHDGIAEALLLAEFGRRLRQGGALFAAAERTA